MPLLDWTYYGNTLEAWIVALMMAGAAFSALLVAKRVAVHHLSALAERTRSGVDDFAVALLRATRPFFLVVLALFLATRFLFLTAEAAAILRHAVVIAVLIQVGLWGNRAISLLLGRYLERRLEEDPATATSLKFLGVVGRIVLWALLALMAVDNLGGNVTTLVAGLGVGGIAVALAVQNILGDLFASLSILLDKPFVIGDFIVVGDMRGTVEHVGLKTTRIRSISGEQIIFSNADLLQSRVRNFKRMVERRVVFNIGVTYGTPPERLAAIPDLVREIIEAREHTRFDRAHLAALGEFSINFEVVYYVLDADYTLYMDIQQATHLELYRRFAALGIDFAFPTRTLHLHAAPAGVEAAVPASSGD